MKHKIRWALHFMNSTRYNLSGRVLLVMLRCKSQQKMCLCLLFVTHKVTLRSVIQCSYWWNALLKIYCTIGLIDSGLIIHLAKQGWRGYILVFTLSTFLSICLYVCLSVAESCPQHNFLDMWNSKLVHVTYDTKVVTLSHIWVFLKFQDLDFGDYFLIHNFDTCVHVLWVLQSFLVRVSITVTTYLVWWCL